MKKRRMTSYLAIICFSLILTACDNPQFTVPTSLHATFEGIEHFARHWMVIPISLEVVSRRLMV